MALLNVQSIKVLPHHKKDEICTSRAKYRDGRRDTAVKVYTINQESNYLLIQGVPAVGAQNELEALCDPYGEVDYIKPLDEYPCEEFTEVYVVKYRFFPAARTAKRNLDDKSFFGGTLHVCYAPEFETVSDTRRKLQERRKYVAWKSKSEQEVKSAKGLHKNSGSKPIQLQTKRLNPTSSGADITSCEPVTYIWAGKEYTVYPQSSEPSNTEQCSEPSSGMSKNLQTNSTSQQFLPRQLYSATRKTSAAVSTSESASSFGGDNKSESKLTSFPSSSTTNPSSIESSYSSSVQSIKKKLLSVAVPNVRVSFKRRKRI